MLYCSKSDRFGKPAALKRRAMVPGAVAVPSAARVADEAPARGGTLTALTYPEPYCLPSAIDPALKWPDGQDFAAAGVAFSLSIWNTRHAHGRQSHTLVTRVEPLDPSTAIRRTVPAARPFQDIP